MFEKSNHKNKCHMCTNIDVKISRPDLITALAYGSVLLSHLSILTQPLLLIIISHVSVTIKRATLD
jgi:hypothetical protein